MYPEYKCCKLLNMTELNEDSFLPEKDYSGEELAELVESISDHGLIMPLHVRERDGKYEVVGGIRRWKAAKYAGIEKVPVTVERLWTYKKQSTVGIEADYKYEINAIYREEDYEKRKNAYERIIRDTLSKGHHIIEMTVAYEDEWTISRILDEIKCSKDDYSLDILVSPIEGSNEEKCDYFLEHINDDNKYNWTQFQFHPEGWGDWNGWHTFYDFLSSIQIKKVDNSLALLAEMPEGKSITVTIADDSTYDEFYDSLLKLDRGIWVVGMDMVDVSEALFKQSSDEAFYMKWTEVSSKIREDIDSFLAQNKKKMLSVMLWVYGNDITLSDAGDAVEYLNNDCLRLIQAIYDENSDIDKSVHALFVCQPDY